MNKSIQQVIREERARLTMLDKANDILETLKARAKDTRQAKANDREVNDLRAAIEFIDDLT